MILGLAFGRPALQDYMQVSRESFREQLTTFPAQWITVLPGESAVCFGKDGCWTLLMVELAGPRRVPVRLFRRGWDAASMMLSTLGHRFHPP